ncbi:CDP-diacylglycerol--glycerol-3-phosphate 3-phosphatidyltransferase [Bacteroidota bacterium]
MIFNLPNIISMIRVIIAPFFLYFLVWGGKGGVELACFLYFIGSATDFFDGWLARKYHEVSNLGKFVDPLADKILTTAAFAAFVLLDIVELWMVIIILLRDFGTTFLRLYADIAGKPIRTSLLAKWKTFLQMVFIAYILILLLLKETEGFTNNILGMAPEEVNLLIYSFSIYIVMLLLTLLTIWTAGEYIVQNKNLFAFFNKKSSVKK